MLKSPAHVLGGAMKTSLLSKVQMVLFMLGFCVPVFARPFLRPVPYAVAGHPLAVGLGHFNHDDIPDIVSLGGSNATNSAVSILLGRGDGTFAKAVSTDVPFPAQQFPGDLAVADLNNDQLSDVIYVTADNTIVVLLSKGGGGFQTPVTYTVTSEAHGLTSGDFDHDGTMDLAVAQSNVVSIFLGNGDGTFQTAVSYAANAPFVLAAGDFDGDGNLDLAASDGYTMSVDVLLGNGDGSFQTAVSYAVGGYANGLLVADFNRDGKPDLGCISEVGQVSVLLGNGDGSFQPPVVTHAEESAAFAVADFNLDGRPDVVVAPSFFAGKYVAVLIGQGDGRLKLGAALTATHIPTRFTVTAGDLNQDALPDIVAGNEETGLVEVFLNKGF